MNPVTVTAVTASAELGGTERVLLDLARYAPEFGVRLTVIAPRDGPFLKALENLDTATEIVPARASLLRGSQQPGHLGTIPSAVLGLIDWARRLESNAKIRSADVVYPVAFKAYLGTAIAHCRPSIWHLHEFPPRTTGGFWLQLARMIPDQLIVNSKAVGERWLIPDHANIHVALNGVELELFRPRPRTHWIHDALGLPHESRIVGMPAVAARWKGQLEVVTAFRAVQDRFPDWHLVLVGGNIYDTASDTAFENEINEAVAPEAQIHRLPFQQKVQDIYPEFDFTIHYSLRPEPFGRVIVESMACGVPVVGAAEGGPIEILGPRLRAGEARTAVGWLTPPRAPDQLASVLASAITSGEDKLQEIGRTARQRAEERFSARTFARTVCEVLRMKGGRGVRKRSLIALLSNPPRTSSTTS